MKRYISTLPVPQGSRLESLINAYNRRLEESDRRARLGLKEDEMDRVDWAIETSRMMREIRAEEARLNQVV